MDPVTRVFFIVKDGNFLIPGISPSHVRFRLLDPTNVTIGGGILGK
jgi:hypothetical protein